MSDSDARYAEIIRRLAERRAEKSQASLRTQQDELMRCLDALDAWGKLEKVTKEKAFKRRCFGPKSVQGIAPSIWAGVVVWCRGTGYYGYRQLDLIGIWARSESGAIQLMFGDKKLAYSAVSYEAEAYHRLIRTAFDIYYTDDGSPPAPQDCHFTTLFDPAQRLESRKQLKDAIEQWLNARGSG